MEKPIFVFLHKIKKEGAEMGIHMRYYYYGREPEGGKKRQQSEGYGSMGRADGRGVHKMAQQGEVIIEEDTIYEIDQECESCRRNRQKSQRYAEN